VTGCAFAYEPQINYALQCMGCHTPDGAGVPDRVPSIRDTLVPLARMAEGRRYLVQVPGSAQSTLDNAELAELLNWMIRSLSVVKVPGNLAPFTEAEVREYRVQTLSQVRETRERLLAASRATQP
jgi:mono/diheme cytochrome c family protein